jgi:cytochrome c-type biogenesis protein CcmF
MWPGKKAPLAESGCRCVVWRWRAVPGAFWGMVLAHAGIGIFVLGVTLVKGTDHAQDASLKVGDAVTLGEYRFQFTDLQKRKGPNYIAGQATFEVSRSGQPVATLHPEKRFYVVQRMPMTEAAIDRGLTRDLYVSLGEATADGAWGVRVQVKPFMAWVWAGCLLMALGGLLAALDRRYRQATQRATASASTPDAAPHLKTAPAAV